jgi:hypothetical protein
MLFLSRQRHPQGCWNKPGIFCRRFTGEFHDVGGEDFERKNETQKVPLWMQMISTSPQSTENLKSHRLLVIALEMIRLRLNQSCYP